MAQCMVVRSPEVARRAARSYFFRRFATPLGIFTVASMVILIALAVVAYVYARSDLLVGVFGTVALLNIAMQLGTYFGLQKAAARAAADPTTRESLLETSDTGVRITTGENSILLPWQRFRKINVDDDFVILGVRPPMTPCVVIPTQGMTPDVRRAFESAAERTP